MSFRSTLSGYPKILNVWSIYFQYCNSQASKQNKELLGFVYGHIPYIPLKQQNEYTGHVSISYYYLIQYVLSSKNPLNCFTTFGSSVSQESLSWVLFGIAIWLPHGQLCATVEGRASITQW